MNATQMIDVSDKAVTAREAKAEGFISLAPETVEAIESGTVPKGNVLETARIAAIQAAKRTPDFIPLCHPLLIAGARCEFRCDADNGSIRVETTVRCSGQTGVEMEALAAAAAALLTIYDMTKGIDETLEIGAIRLLEKRGGRTGTWTRESASTGGENRTRKSVGG
ncbi:MAG TPA: cyclic pyranopterin monophosphate synthase MoaC [Abditibacteriaceae bacterium]|jgi:cyclic pyranopterin phosphate synthase